jgi:predicted deacylase
MTQPVQLQTLTFGDRSAGPHLLITGGVHGDEFEPMMALRILGGLLQKATIRGQVTLVPVVNEAAFAHGHRVAEDGLDLARTCPGRPDGSITERVAFALSDLIRSADYYIDLHTGGTRLTVWPMTGYVLHPDAAILENQRAMARAFNLPVIWGTDPTLPGRSLSVARDAGVPAIYAEYLGGGSVSTAGMEAYVEGCWNVMGHLGMLGYNAPQNAVLCVVEDPRPNSGHMQRCYPSPMDGYFAATAPLGHQVDLAQTIGVVCDALGNRSEFIRANERGLILVLRTFPSVKQGDSLAVILDTSYAVKLR